MYFLQSRVAIVDVFKFMSNGGNGFTWIVITIIICILLLRLLISYLTRDIKKQSKTTRLILLSIFFIASWLIINNNTLDDINNIVTINVSEIKNRIQNNHKKKWAKTFQDYIWYINWEWKDVNIILLFAESLSAIDSDRDWWYNHLPYFDKIQANGITFTNFIANGSTSDSSHISTLMWIIPLSGIWIQETPYTWYKSRDLPLAEFLNQQWYKTTFISAATLEFLKQRDFIKNVWFQTIIWEEEFKDKKKYTFDAAPDEDLYSRTIQEVKNQTGKFFIWLQTISFHIPHNTPYWKTEESALSYSDNSLYYFYNQLKEIWYFDSGILIIVWDHRKPLPAEQWEENLMWNFRYWKVVATIIWSGITPWTYNNNIIQHTDIYNSIKRLVGTWNVKVAMNYNDIFSNDTNRDRWIISRPYHENKYTITYWNHSWFTFNNVSSLKKINEELYKYFLAYTRYQYWNNTYGDTTIIGHKWAPNYAPENSIKSFITANKLGAKGVEFDISYTKDRKNIVTHWQYLKDSNCSDKKVWEYTYEWIKENCTLNDWESFNTLAETLWMIDWLFDYYFLEIKVYDETLWAQQTQEAIQTVKDLNMEDKVIFISYSDSARKVLEQEDDIIFGRDTYDVWDLDFIWKNNSKYFLAPIDKMTPEIVEKAESIWKQVATYTINSTWDYQKAKDLWIDIILTDDIKTLKDYDIEKEKSKIMTWSSSIEE